MSMIFNGWTSFLYPRLCAIADSMDTWPPPEDEVDWPDNLIELCKQDRYTEIEDWMYIYTGLEL